MLTVSVQAGGQSRRMGREKAMIPFLGQALIARVVARVRPAAREIILIAPNPAPFQFLGLPVFPDRIPGMGVLGGLYTSLSAAHQPFVALIACDMPFANPALLSFQLELIQTSGADVAISQSDHGLEPLHAVYRRDTCLPLVENALRQGQMRLNSWFGRAVVRILSPDETAACDPQGFAFTNINTPEELARAEALAQDESL